MDRIARDEDVADVPPATGQQEGRRVGDRGLPVAAHQQQIGAEQRDEGHAEVLTPRGHACQDAGHERPAARIGPLLVARRTRNCQRGAPTEQREAVVDIGVPEREGDRTAEEQHRSGHAADQHGAGDPQRHADQADCDDEERERRNHLGHQVAAEHEAQREQQVDVVREQRIAEVFVDRKAAVLHVEPRDRQLVRRVVPMSRRVKRGQRGRYEEQQHDQQLHDRRRRHAASHQPPRADHGREARQRREQHGRAKRERHARRQPAGQPEREQARDVRREAERHGEEPRQVRVAAARPVPGPQRQPPEHGEADSRGVQEQ